MKILIDLLPQKVQVKEEFRYGLIQLIHTVIKTDLFLLPLLVESASWSQEGPAS